MQVENLNSARGNLVSQISTAEGQPAEAQEAVSQDETEAPFQAAATYEPAPQIKSRKFSFHTQKINVLHFLA